MNGSSRLGFIWEQVNDAEVSVYRWLLDQCAVSSRVRRSLWRRHHLVIGWLVVSGRRPGREPWPYQLEVWQRTRVALIGAVQVLWVSFCGFSRSGATISNGLLLGVSRRRAEEFSFALAVILAPAVIAKEGYRFAQAHAVLGNAAPVWRLLGPSLAEMGLSFLAGLAALRWLGPGRWHYLGTYCLIAALIVLAVG